MDGGSPYPNKTVLLFYLANRDETIQHSICLGFLLLVSLLLLKLLQNVPLASSDISAQLAV